MCEGVWATFIMCMCVCGCVCGGGGGIYARTHDAQIANVHLYNNDIIANVILMHYIHTSTLAHMI